MPSVTVTKPIRPVELMAAREPGDVLIDALRILGSEGAAQARTAGADADDVLLPRLTLSLTLSWE